jgi:TolA-binding protein
VKQQSPKLRATAFAVLTVAFVSGHVRPASAQDAAQPPAKPAPTQKAKSSDGDAGLRQRVEQLEEQLVDLQVVIGTLESLARSGAAGSSSQTYRAPAAGGAGDAGRIEALETQVRALSSQVEQLTGQGGRTSAAAPPVWQASPSPPTPPPVTANDYGSTTVNSTQTDQIGGLLDDGASAYATDPAERTQLSPAGGTPGGIERSDLPDPTQTSPGAAAPGGAVAAIDPAAGGTPKQDYERAYGYLLQQNYGAAQSGFIDFLKQYPKDSLVPNALYWLGETHYVQKNFADAAEAFDIVTQGYAR